MFKEWLRFRGYLKSVCAIALYMSKLLKVHKALPDLVVYISMQVFFQYRPISFMLGRPLARSGRFIPIHSCQKLALRSSTLEYSPCSVTSLFNLYGITLDYVFPYGAQAQSLDASLNFRRPCKSDLASNKDAYCYRLIWHTPPRLHPLILLHSVPHVWTGLRSLLLQTLHSLRSLPGYPCSDLTTGR
jgi:hypothetical protein